jgi:hypothetical protein
VSVYRGPETQVLRANCSNAGLQARADCVRSSRVPTSILWIQQWGVGKRFPYENVTLRNCIQCIIPHAICTKIGVRSLSTEPMMASYTSHRSWERERMCWNNLLWTHTEAATWTTWKKIKDRWIRSGPGEHLAWCKKLASFMKMWQPASVNITLHFWKDHCQLLPLISDVYLLSKAFQWVRVGYHEKFLKKKTHMVFTL